MRTATRSLAFLGNIVGLFTLAIGFIPFLVLSLKTKSFWPKSAVAVPLTLVPSVLIGDSILIPLFNRAAVPILVRILGRESPTSGRMFMLLSAALATALGVAVNLPIHKLWMKGGNTGFISLKPGVLSVAGIWHLAFASAEMGFVIWFVVGCLKFGQSLSGVDRDSMLAAWRLFMLYSSLSIADFIFWQFLILRSRTFSLSDLLAIITLPLTVIVYFMLKAVTGSRSI